jgi:hypothetical protein
MLDPELSLDNIKPEDLPPPDPRISIEDASAAYYAGYTAIMDSVVHGEDEELGYQYIYDSVKTSKVAGGIAKSFFLRELWGLEEPLLEPAMRKTNTGEMPVAIEA